MVYLWILVIFKAFGIISLLFACYVCDKRERELKALKEKLNHLIDFTDSVSSAIANMGITFNDAIKNFKAMANAMRDYVYENDPSYLRFVGAGLTYLGLNKEDRELAIDISEKTAYSLKDAALVIKEERQYGVFVNALYGPTKNTPRYTYIISETSHLILLPIRKEGNNNHKNYRFPQF